MIKRLGRNDDCWCGSGKKYKVCHIKIDEKIKGYKANGHIVPARKLLKTVEQIEGIKESCKVNTEILNCLSSFISEGITTAEIDRLVYTKTKELGGTPATLNYNGYTKSICTSVNEQVCHGIPSENVILKNGDIINIDVSTEYKGYFSDSSRMFCIGSVLDENKRLVNVAKECMELGIQQVRPWGFLGDIGYAVNEHAKKNGYSVVREIGGHGIGLEFHEDPWVSYVSKAGTGMLLVTGMVFTIEPMINMGTHKVTTRGNDKWTVYTADGKPSAQWESTVLVTESGCEVLA